jgi:hypothetical protein
MVGGGSGRGVERDERERGEEEGGKERNQSLVRVKCATNLREERALPRKAGLEDTKGEVKRRFDARAEIWATFAKTDGDPWIGAFFERKVRGITGEIFATGRNPR